MPSADRLRLELRRARGPFAVLMVLVVCSVTITAALVANQTFQRPWEGYQEVKVAFDDAKGVVPGQQEVRIAGVKVGLIKSAELEGTRPVVTLAIRDKYAPVYRNATFRLRPKTPLQDMYVEMKRGNAAAGRLPDDRVIPANQTVTPVDVSRVLQTFNGDTSTRLRTLLDGFGKGLDGRGDDLRRAFVELAPFLTAADAVSDQLALQRARLRQLVGDSGSLLEELGSRDRDLRELVDYGNTTLATLARSDVPLKETIEELPGTVRALRTSLTALGRAQDDLDPALVALRPAVRRLGPGLDAVNRLAGDLEPAARALKPAVDALLPLSRLLPSTATSLSSATSALRPQIQDVDLAVRQLEKCETPFARFFSWTLSVVKLRDSYTVYPRGTVSGGLDTVQGNPITGLTKSPNCSDLVK
jgi:ABC-type transporter Mla subunit MlaD